MNHLKCLGLTTMLNIGFRNNKMKSHSLNDFFANQIKEIISSEVYYIVFVIAKLMK